MTIAHNIGSTHKHRAPAASKPASPPDKRPHAVVIGSGFGGLAAAVRLGARGYRVTVLERQDAVGGRAYVRKREGFTFDSGPTVITAPFMFEDLWALCGKKLEDEIDMRPVTPFYRIRFDDGSLFDYTGDAAEMRREVAKYAPNDVDGYERFVQASEEIFKVGFEQLAHIPFSRVMDMARIIPEMIRLGSFRSVYSMVSRYFKNEKLRQVMSFHPLLVGGNPFSTTSIYTLIAFLERKWGVHFPMGGTGALVNGLVSLIEGQGGRILLNSHVDKIVTEGRRVTGVQCTDRALGGTRIFAADVVVSNADSANTYRKLIDASARKTWTDKKVERSRYSMGLFVWYFGTDKTYADVAHHTILLGPRYKGLLADIFDKKVVAEDFSLYLHRPTATDPSLAPSGCESFYVLSPVPHLESGTDWNAFGETYRKRIEKYLEDSVLPGLSSHIKYSEFITPQFFNDELQSFQGAAFGIEPVLTQSAYFRPHNQSEDFDNLYLVGAGTHPGAGVPGVLSSAKVLDSIVPHGSTVATSGAAGREAAAHEGVAHDGAANEAAAQ
jgi:phytoene desaturase